jgi:hypothetical protein
MELVSLQDVLKVHLEAHRSARHMVEASTASLTTAACAPSVHNAGVIFVLHMVVG